MVVEAKQPNIGAECRFSGFPQRGAEVGVTWNRGLALAAGPAYIMSLAE